MFSNKKKCPNCPQVMPCATKVCKACGAEQPKKARLMKRLQALDMKKGEWLGNLKKKHNEAAMWDEAIILVCTINTTFLIGSPHLPVLIE